MVLTEPPWITEMRRAVDTAWEQHLREERQRNCQHARMTKAEEIDATTFAGQNVLYLAARCEDCGWEEPDDETP